MYNKLSGMTGTAKTEENEFISTYNLPVVQIPTNKPVIRKDLEDKLYKTEKAKYLAVLKTIESVHLTGQPILVGTASIENQKLKEETLGIIALLNLQYWCEDENEKKRLKEVNLKISIEDMEEKEGTEIITQQLPKAGIKVKEGVAIIAYN